MTDRIKCTRCGAESHADGTQLYCASCWNFMLDIYEISANDSLDKLIAIGRLQAKVADLGLSLLDMIEYAQSYAEYAHRAMEIPGKAKWIERMDEDIAKAKALVKVSHE